MFGLWRAFRAERQVLPDLFGTADTAPPSPAQHAARVHSVAAGVRWDLLRASTLGIESCGSDHERQPRIGPGHAVPRARHDGRNGTCAIASGPPSHSEVAHG